MHNKNTDQEKATACQKTPTFDEACSHPAIQSVLIERDHYKAHADKLAEALRVIAQRSDGMRPAQDYAAQVAKQALAEYEASNQ
jgi:hypothetical protein